MRAVSKNRAAEFLPERGPKKPLGGVGGIVTGMGMRQKDKETLRISLGRRLRSCPEFRCLGILPNWKDYSHEEQRLIQEAEKIYYPGPHYDTVLRSLGKGVFPENYYSLMGNKILQTNLFQLLGIPHPRTRVYYGNKRLQRICADFPYPFLAKTPVGSSRGLGVWLIHNEDDLASYLVKHRPAYIQEYLPIERDLRVVLINGKVIHAYWRTHRAGEFRNNVSLGAEVSFSEIPAGALSFARHVVSLCGFGEVGLDICSVEDIYYVIEANMVFGLEGFHQAGLDIHAVLARMGGEGAL